MMYCTHCGHQNHDDANFCGECGRPLKGPSDTTTGSLLREDVPDLEKSELQVEVEATLAGLEEHTALLVAVRGPNAGARFLLDRELTKVGRHPASDIFLDDITVSRRHAEFQWDGDRFSVTDVGSLNGTYVNGQRTAAQTLATGSEVQIGKFRLVVFLSGKSG